MSTSAGPADLDPVTASIIRHGLDAAADQMLVTLRRTAFSPIIYEMLDGGGALYDARFQMLSHTEMQPLFVGSMGLCLEALFAERVDKESLVEGDVVVINDPFVTGTHQWDVAVAIPGFVDGKIVAYAALKAHHMDIGAMAPYVTNSTDVFQEGTIYPGVKLFRAGVRDEDLFRTMLANTRLPDSAVGDLGAQIGACKAGLRALLELVDNYGLATFEAAVERILDAGEAEMRECLAEIPGGRYTATAVHEHNGHDLVMVPYDVTVEIRDDEVTIDLTDAPPPQPGPVNSPRVGTISAVRCAMVALAIKDGRANEGYFRPLELVTRPGSMFDAEPPAPCALASFPLYIVVEGINEALAQAVPDRMPSGYDLCVSMVMWGLDQNERFWANGMNLMGGQPAALAYGDGGVPLMPIGCSGVRGISWEAWESKTPTLVESTDFAPDSPGTGCHRGGPGVDFAVRALADLEMTLITERSAVPPFALKGGRHGRRTVTVVDSGHGPAKEQMKVTGLPVASGGVVRISTSGGAGWGDPAARPAEAIHADIEAGLMTEAASRERYPHAFED